MQLQTIQNKIYVIRDQNVMLDFDLAEMYEVETKVLNQAIKRNITRFLLILCSNLLMMSLKV